MKGVFILLLMGLAILGPRWADAQEERNEGEGKVQAPEVERDAFVKHSSSESLKRKAGILFLETVGGCALNFMSLMAFAATAPEGDSPDFYIIPETFLLSPLPSSVGVAGVGHLFKQKGSWIWSLTGGAICQASTILVFNTINHIYKLSSSGDALMAMFIGSQCSPILSMVGYNLGPFLPKHKWISYSVAGGILASCVVYFLNSL